VLDVYAATLRLAGEPNAAWRAARAALRLAAGQPHGGWPQDLDPNAGRWTPGDGVLLRWSSLHDDDIGRAWSLRIDAPASSGRETRSRTVVHVTADHDACTVHVTESLQANGPVHGAVDNADTTAHALVRAIVSRTEALDGVHRVEPTAVHIDATTLARTSILITDPHRTLPAVVVHRGPRLAEELGEQLAGVAHVASTGDDAGAPLFELLDLGASQEGDVLVLWPGWQLGDDWPKAQRWARRAALDDPDRAAAPVVAAIRRAACLAGTPPPLVEALGAAQIRRRIDGAAHGGRITEDDSPPPPPIFEHPPAVDDTHAPPAAEAIEVADVRRPETTADARAWEADLRALADARDEVQDLREEVRRLDVERDGLVALLTTRFEEEVQRGIELRTDRKLRGPRSLGEAVERASRELEHVVVLPAAIEQAQLWPFLQPAKVFEHLRLLDAITGRWQRGNLQEGLHAAVLAAGLPWAREVSATARRRFPQDYTIRFEDRALLLGPHLRYGSGPPTRQCRLYFALLHDQRALLLGHVGAHLRGHRDR
jgi:hypothetical protein